MDGIQLFQPFVFVDGFDDDDPFVVMIVFLCFDLVTVVSCLFFFEAKKTSSSPSQSKFHMLIVFVRIRTNSANVFLVVIRNRSANTSSRTTQWESDDGIWDAIVQGR